LDSGLLGELVEDCCKANDEQHKPNPPVAMLHSISSSKRQLMRAGREMSKTHRKSEELLEKLARHGLTNSHPFSVGQLADPGDDSARLALLALLFLLHPSLEYDKVAWMEDELHEMSSMCNSALESSSISESAEETVCETVIRKFIKLRQEHKQMVWSMLAFDALRG